MNAFTTVSLSEDDLKPYKERIGAVRLFINGRYYLGTFKWISLNGRECFLGLEPYGRLAHDSSIGPKPLAPDIVVDGDNPIARSISRDSQPFKLVDPEKIVWEKERHDVLGIAFKTGTVVISCRLDHVVHAERILHAMGDARTEPH